MERLTIEELQNAVLKFDELGYDEETHTLIVQLWNTKKLDKIYGIKGDKKWKD